MSRWNTIFWSLSALGGVWAIFVSLLTRPWVQRHALYAHRIHTAWWHDINTPESFGFAERQVTPFRITTADNETLYAWHILPLGLYTDHQASIMDQPQREGLQGTRAFELLQDPQSRLVISCHIGQGWRTDSYKALYAADDRCTHVVAFDYRGFGVSTGNPTEKGLITDGVAMVEWAAKVANVPKSRTVLLGHSLGTAVVAGVLERLGECGEDLGYAGALLSSGFTDIPNLMKTYAIAGFVPILSPLKPYPRIEKIASNFIVEVWDTATRLTRIAATNPNFRVHLIHSQNDFDIGWKHSEALFSAIESGISQSGFQTEIKNSSSPGAHIQTLVGTSQSGKAAVKQPWVRWSRLRYGGHNRLLTYAPIAIAVRRLFEAATDDGVP